MSINIACFIIGVIFGVVGIIIIACCSVASDCDREEERHNRSQ